MKRTFVVRASVVAALALGMIGVSAGTASARVPARCDGTVQTVSTLGGGFVGSKFGTVEWWTNWVLTQDAAGHTVWRYTYSKSTYNGPFGVVLTTRQIETCAP